MIQQISTQPCTQDMQTMVQQPEAGTPDSGGFHSLLLKSAQSAKTGASAETTDSTSVPQDVSKDRPGEDSAPAVSGDSLQTVQAMLLAAQTAAGEAPALQVPAPSVKAPIHQLTTEVSPAQQNAQTPAPAATGNLPAQPLPLVSEEKPQAAAAQIPAQAVPAAAAVESAQTAQAVQTVQTPQTMPDASPRAAETGTEIRQNMTETPIADLPPTTAQAVQTPQQTSAAAAEPVPGTEKADFAVSQKTQPLDPKADTAEQILPQKREKEPAAERSPVPASQQTSVAYSPEKVTVKISDTPAAAKTPVSSQVADAVVQNFKAGKQQFQVDLYPQSLGKVSVKLLAENGTLTIEIAAANPKTQSLLASSSGEIRSLLHASTGQTVQVTAQQPGSQQYPDHSGAWQQQQQQSSSQQQQENAERRAAAIWYSADNSTGLSTADFLTVLRKAAV